MRHFITSLAAIIWFCGASHAMAASTANTLKLTPSPPLMKDVDAFARVVEGAKPDIITRINEALTQLDKTAFQNAQACLQENGGEFTRETQVTMQGPQFLSLVEYTNSFCGGAHDNSSLVALVFDLTTGEPVNWEKLLPTVKLVKYDPDIAQMDPFDIAVSSPTLLALYKKQAMHEVGGDSSCKNAFDDIDFKLALDARQNAVAVHGVGFPHAVRACGTTLYLRAKTLKSLGASQAFIKALDAAHRSCMTNVQCFKEND